jgi:hypothetical protein
MGIKMARFNMNKSLEDYRITLYRVSMAARWTQEWKQGWEDRGTAACEELMKQADQTPEKAKHPETEEARLKIIENGKDKLVDLTEVVQTEAEDNSRKKFSELNSEELFNRSCVLNMTQISEFQ